MNRTFYVTTPIYYVNGRPHIGHAYTTIAADAFARYQRAKGRPAFFLTGTDEHGQKVLEKAESRGMSPRAHADDMVETAWKPVMQRLGISYDVFMRTTADFHVAAVQEVLTRLHGEGLLYKDTYEGWYSPAAEKFWTEKDLVDGNCPDTGLPVQRVEESNWFFRMSRFQEPLLQHIEANPGFLRPENRRNEVLGFLRKPLGDLCISRPKARMSWGIEIPFDTDFVTYVWFDALLNYLTAIGYSPSRGWDADRWPAALQLVGKDILTTHAVYWTTMLMALGAPLPKTLFAHGWWLAGDGRKMSKSLDNTVDVDLLAGSFGVDALRYYLLREISFGADGAFTYEGFLNRYNADLANDLGNLAHRGLSMTTNWLGGVVPPVDGDTGREAALAALFAEVVPRYDAAFEDFDPQGALAAVGDLVRAGNKYIDDTQPWALNKAGQHAELRTALRSVLEIAHAAAVMLRPVMPEKSAELLTKLGRTAEQADAALRTWLGGAPKLDLLEVGAALSLGDPLFPRFREQPPAVQAELDRITAAAAALEAAAPAPEPKAKPKGKAKVAEPPAQIAYEDFAKVALRVGKVVAAEKHPSADKLLVLRVDIGEAQPRQIVAGIATRYAPDELVGKSVVVVANLAPAMLRGVESQGMLLAAGGAAVIDLVSVEAPAGEVVR